MPATRGDLSGRPAALAGKGSTEGGTEGFARPVPSCGPVCRTRKGGKTTEVGDEIDRREIWRIMDQLTGGPAAEMKGIRPEHSRSCQVREQQTFQLRANRRSMRPRVTN